ncbi:hypothetical protein [Mangrovicoccus sp. HB161399]|uniref:hypothetical protein n=1 Tax=Mangrovicoccus sp. HB161399 TaxID=2720392 RepID=UPI001554DF8B|nr:hypothetical protein [Mangrovicoccus sp. HB161399]
MSSAARPAQNPLRTAENDHFRRGHRLQGHRHCAGAALPALPRAFGRRPGALTAVFAVDADSLLAAVAQFDQARGNFRRLLPKSVGMIHFGCAGPAAMIGAARKIQDFSTGRAQESPRSSMPTTGMGPSRPA